MSIIGNIWHSMLQSFTALMSYESEGFDNLASELVY